MAGWGWDERPADDWKNRDRVGALFRRHVKSPCHPRGVIKRRKCVFCGSWGKRVGDYWHRPEVHHVDYSKPFLVAHVCWDCHRKVDRGELAVEEKHLVDHWPEVKDHVRPKQWGPRPQKMSRAA